MHPKAFFQSISSFLVISILLIACLIIPEYNAIYFGVTGTKRAVILFVLVILFGIVQLFQEKKDIPFYTADLAWFGLIGLTACSIFWSTNDIYALYGLASTSLLYLCYKAFEDTDWKGKPAKYGTITLIFCCFIVLGLAIYLLKGRLSSGWLPHGSFKASSLGFNFNYLGSWLLVLLPFALFWLGQKSKVISIVVMLTVLPVIYVSGSAQVLLGTVFLALFYVLYQIKIPLKQLRYLFPIFILGLVIVLSVIYINKGTLQGISFVIDEFYTQSDRFWMWEGCLKMLADAPFFGQGKNSWYLEVSAFDLKNCLHCNSEFKPRRFNHAHNSVFQTLGELGISGLAMYIILAVLPIVQLLKKRIKLSTLELAALTSLVLFFLMSLMYGVVYNYFNHFSGLTVLVVFNLAILSKITSTYTTPKFAINNMLFYPIYSLIALSGLFFFYQFDLAHYHMNAGNTHFRKKENDQAMAAYLKAFSYWDTSEIYYRLALLYKRENDFPTALTYYQKALEKDPYDVQIHAKYANFLLINNKNELAQAAALKTLELSPRFIPNKIVLIRCYKRIGEMEKAISLTNALKDDLKKRLERYEQKQQKRKKTGKKVSKKVRQHIKQVKRHVDILEDMF